MNDDIYDDQDDDLSTKIKRFLSKDSNFRDPTFDTAPYLIKVLKEKQANQELLVQKQTQLVDLQNQAQELIEEITIEKSEDFLQLLKIPQQFGEQLEKLKHNMANVKKKVKETKTLLIMTQKDIQQIHLNCVFNKLIYRRLKEIQLKLSQYETASLALKNHLYLQCAQNLPVFTGTSVLQNTLAARSQNLKLRFLSQAIQQIRLFLYFTPRLSLPTTHRFIERSDQKQQIFSQIIHQSFYKRYLLFKRARSQEYLSSIWQIQNMQQKTGRVGVIHDIIKGIIRIGKSNEITDSLSLDSKKSINNIFLVLAFFFSKEPQHSQKESRLAKWFTNPQTHHHTVFINALFCVSAALLRKIVIVRKICYEYQLEQVCQNLSSQKILQIIRDQIYDLIKNIYFPETTTMGTSYEFIQEQLMNKLRKKGSFVIWAYFKKIIETCLQILSNQLRLLQKQLFQKDFPEVEYFLKPFTIFHKKCMQQFHQQFMKTLQQIFTQGRGFNLQSLDSILSVRQYRKSEIQFCSKYCSQDKKTNRQFLNLISILNSLQAYFIGNNFEPKKYKQYMLFIIVFFYLKLNSTIYRYVISPTQYDKIIEVRLKDPKVRNKQKHIQSRYENIFIPRIQIKPKVDKKHYKHIENDHPQLRNVDQLKMIRTQIEMFMFYASNNFGYLQQTLKNTEVQRFQRQLQKHEPSNYDQNISAKLLRVWQQLIKPLQQIQVSQNCVLVALFRRLIQLYFNISACLYLQTGVY